MPRELSKSLNSNSELTKPSKMLMMKPHQLKKMINNRNSRLNEQGDVKGEEGDHLPFKSKLLSFAEEIDTGLVKPCMKYSSTKSQIEATFENYVNKFRQKYAVFRVKILQESKQTGSKINQ